MAISIGGLVVIGILLVLTFVVLLCAGHSSSVVDAVSKRLGIGSNDPETELSKDGQNGSGPAVQVKQGNSNEHIQMEEGVSDRYTDAPTTTRSKDDGDDTGDDSDEKETYDYPTPNPTKVTEREVPVPEELKETGEAHKGHERIGDNSNVELGVARMIDDLPAYENAKIVPKALPRKNVPPTPSANVDKDDDEHRVYQNVSTGK